MAIKSYRELGVWQKAMDLVVECYRIAKLLPKTELYGLTSQIQRAAVSIPANIAEGQGRSHTKEFLNHLSMAYGSLMELETHLQIAARLEYVEPDSVFEPLEQCAEVGRMLNGLRRKLSDRLRDAD